MVTEFPHFNNDEAEGIEGEITLNEACVALRSMKHSNGLEIYDDVVVVDDDDDDDDDDEVMLNVLRCQLTY